MDENKTPYVKIALAVAIGIMVGAIVGSGDSEDVRALNARIAQLEEAAAQQAAELEAAAASQASALEEATASRLEEIKNAAGEQAAALAARVDELAASLGEVPEVDIDGAIAPIEEALSADKGAIAEIREELAALREATPDVDEEAAAAFDALSKRVNTLAQQLGQVITSGLNEGTLTPPPAAEPATSPEAAPAETPAAEPSAAPATEPGEVGFMLSVGDTAMVGDSRLFVSRIDAAQEAVRLMVVGDGPRMLGKGYGPLEMANGCSVTLKNIVDSMAMVVADCPTE
jgi:hypothetical protein